MLPSRLYFPITVYPATTARLPLDFTAASNRTDVSDCKSHHYDAHNHDVGSFGLQTQSVRLLDEVCSFRKQSEHDLDRYLPEAAAIDARLWQFMSVVIDECGRNRAFSCGSIGTAGRYVTFPIPNAVFIAKPAHTVFHHLGPSISYISTS